ncbi:hypothetical protein H0H92_012623 [Tricholoma furcatifolium]|nr:hypothetical protein H0H92_012623 [Tricholoma furcatifolium]
MATRDSNDAPKTILVCRLGIIGLTRTFKVLCKEEEKEGEGIGVMMIVQREFYVGEKHMGSFEAIPDFTVCTPDVRPAWATDAAAFTSLTMDTPCTSASS